MPEEKQNLNIPKNWEPEKLERDLYQKWEASGYFNPDNLDLPEDAPSYTIILPPPNITDKLHVGHSSMLAIEDLLIRFHRMRGYRTLWLPGTDHAAIATQNVVEKKLLKEEGKTRHDLGREKFLEKVWEFLKETQAVILNQTRRMGASLEWSREAFTLDDQRKKAVTKMFVDMYNAGVIYRGERIVNWCPRCHSTLADDEVEYEERKTKLYWLKYGPFVLATTRPETKLGDTAVAVHPDDERYKDMIGKEYDIPGVLGEFKIKVVADKEVDREFGTGAIKVTPAHSFIDNEIAQRHSLPAKQIINEDGRMMENCGKYAGMTTAEAREAIVEDIKKMDLIDRIEDEYIHNAGICYRCGSVIEPLLSKQWFLSVDKKIDFLGNKSLKEKAIEVTKTKEIDFIPERFQKRYLSWMENLHDWCISRQIWFGHRIPVWYKTTTNNSQLTVGDDKNQEIYAGGNPPEGEGWTQDPDTLDTWFSSGMWTFSTLGWPDNYQDNKKTGDLAKFHPTQVLETGYEILTLWVSRMIMMSLFALREIPFEKVYLHGMVLDKEGKKMSKSKGNGVDPVEMIDKYGTDAVRLSLLIGSTPGNDIRMSEEKIESFKKFINKLWNISRFILQKTASNDDVQKDEITLADRWIIQKFIELVDSTTNDISSYQFSRAGERLRDFTWNEFADWYLEISKIEKNESKNKILKMILKDLLKLWHPYTPFVTEKIWENLENDNTPLLMISDWPDTGRYQEIAGAESSKEKTDDFQLLQQIISSIRNARSEYQIKPAQEIEVTIFAGNRKKLIEKNAELLEKMQTGISKLNILEKGDRPQGAYGEVLSGVEIFVHLEGVVDIEKEKERIQKEIERKENILKSANEKLANEKFSKNAPDEVVKKEKEKKSAIEAQIEKLSLYVNNLK